MLHSLARVPASPTSSTSAGGSRANERHDAKLSPRRNLAATFLEALAQSRMHKLELELRFYRSLCEVASRTLADRHKGDVRLRLEGLKEDGRTARPEPRATLACAEAEGEPASHDNAETRRRRHLTRWY